MFRFDGAIMMAIENTTTRKSI